MNPNAVNRVAIAATVSAVVLAVTVVAGGRRCQQMATTAPATVEVAMNEERAAAEMARAEAEMAQVEAERTTAEAEQVTEARAEVAMDNGEDSEATDREEEFNKIRQAAKEFVKNALPDTKSDGVFLLPLYPESLFIAGVDTQLPDGKRKTIDLLVRRYARKAGSSYWRAESLDGGQNTVIKTKR